MMSMAHAYSHYEPMYAVYNRRVGYPCSTCCIYFNILLARDTRLARYNAIARLSATRISEKRLKLGL